MPTVWLLIRLEEDYETQEEVVGVYATEALARMTAEAECVEVVTPWTHYPLMTPPQWELRGLRDPRSFWERYHREPPSWLWTLAEYPVIKAEDTPPCPGP